MFPVVSIKNIKVVILGLSVSFLYACGGGGDDNPVPAGSTIEIFPESITWDIVENPECSDGDPATPAFSDQIYTDHYIQVTAADSSDRPLGEIKLMVSLELADNTTGPFVGTTLKLYEDTNSNGVIDDPDELISDVDDPVFVARTDEFSGTKDFMLRVNVACPYKGNLNVFTEGTAFKQMNVSVDDSAP